ncbi:hypothetical protein CsSME_00046969 [Camellia sinensis var. sinensis]
MVRPLNIVLLAILALVFLLSMIKPHEASRVLNEKEENLLLPSLRVPIPPWGPNPPTYIPTPSIKASTINQKSFASHVMPPPKAEVQIKKENSFLRSMKRGLVPSKGPNPPTYSPPPSIKASTINQKSFAGPVMSPPEVEGRIKKENSFLNSMKRGLVPSTGPNPPTYSPPPIIKASTINQKSFAGHVMSPPEAEGRIKKENSFLHSMKRSLVPSTGPNPPTYIPPPIIKASTINQKSFACHVMPPPEAEDQIKKENSFLRSMKRSLVPSPRPNPPTYIPPPSIKASTISQKNFAGHVMPPPETEKWIKKENNLLLSMKRSPVPSKGPYPPTYIPPPNIKASTISQETFVGHAMPPPEVKERIKKENNLLRSMKRSPVPPFGPNPFTYIPTPSIKASTISQKSFARSW